MNDLLMLFLLNDVIESRTGQMILSVKNLFWMSHVLFHSFKGFSYLKSHSSNTVQIGAFCNVLLLPFFGINATAWNNLITMKDDGPFEIHEDKYLTR